MDGLSLYKFFRCCNEAFGNTGDAGARGTQVNSLLLWNDAIYLNLYRKEVHSIGFTFGSGRASLAFVRDTFSSKRVGVFENLQGGIIQGFSTHNHDRIGFVDISKRRPSGKVQQFRLVFEIVGAMSNFFILDGETGRILYNLNQRNMDGDRSIGVSEIYQPFASNKAVSLAGCGVEGALAVLPPPHTGKITSEEGAAHFMGVEGFSKPTALAAGRIVAQQGYNAGLKHIVDELNLNVGTNFYVEEAALLPFTSLQGAVRDDSVQVFDALSPDVGAYLQSLTPREANLRISVASLIRKGLKKYEQLCKGLRTELANASSYDKYRHEADLLKMNLHLIKGRGKYTLTRYTEEGVEAGIEYTYNSDLHVHDYMKRLYHRAGRLERGIPIIQERLRLMESYVSFYQEQQHYCETAPYGELLYMRSNVLLLGKKGGNVDAKGRNKLGRGGSKGKGKGLDARIKNQGFYRFELNGVMCMLGKNSRGNHELLGEALPSDYWVHAQGVPSAHGIIRWNAGNAGSLSDNHDDSRDSVMPKGLPENKFENKFENKPEDLLEGLIMEMAQLVAFFTKTTNKRVEIDYTMRKNVRKVKGSPLGFVTYKGFSTVVVDAMERGRVEEIIGETLKK